MAETSSPSPEESGQNLIAPLWHTLVVVVILLGFSALGARSQRLGELASGATGASRGT